MHSQNIIHRDIKLENIVFSCVRLFLFREWQKYVILDGQSTKLRTLDQRSVEHLSICLPKSSKERNTTQR